MGSKLSQSKSGVTGVKERNNDGLTSGGIGRFSWSCRRVASWSGVANLCSSVGGGGD